MIFVQALNPQDQHAIIRNILFAPRAYCVLAGSLLAYNEGTRK